MPGIALAVQWHWAVQEAIPADQEASIGSAVNHMWDLAYGSGQPRHRATRCSRPPCRPARPDTELRQKTRSHVTGTYLWRCFDYGSRPTYKPRPRGVPKDPAVNRNSREKSAMMIGISDFVLEP